MEQNIEKNTLELRKASLRVLNEQETTSIGSGEGFLVSQDCFLQYTCECDIIQ